MIIHDVSSQDVKSNESQEEMNCSQRILIALRAELEKL